MRALTKEERAALSHDEIEWRWIPTSQYGHIAMLDELTRLGLMDKWTDQLPNGKRVTKWQANENRRRALRCGA